MLLFFRLDIFTAVVCTYVVLVEHLHIRFSYSLLTQYISRLILVLTKTIILVLVFVFFQCTNFNSSLVLVFQITNFHFNLSFFLFCFLLREVVGLDNWATTDCCSIVCLSQQYTHVLLRNDSSKGFCFLGLPVYSTGHSSFSDVIS